MARLLDDLLEASRVTQDKIDLRKRVVDLGAVAKDAVDAVRNVIDARGLQFSMTLDPEPLWVEGDPARLQQIQVNLLNNAAKYTPRGGHVSLETKREGDHAVVRVRDDGAGIPKEMLDTVFELFVQSTRTLDRADGGLGVGLTLVRGLVAKHGGTVTASSDGEGKGSEFTVRLPLTETATPAIATRPVLEPGHSPKGSKIVVIDDNADGRIMLCELLGLAGFECHTAATGDSGLDLITEVCPDIAIVDIGLPGMDGFEVARRIRQSPKCARIYLIAITGYGQDSDRVKALAAGFDRHLVKPVDTEVLLALLNEGKRESRSA
jgi:two-component system CheB/CheR fusion protein